MRNILQNEHLVQVPLVTRPGPPPAQFVGEARTELQTPSADILVRNNPTALGKDQLDIPKAQAEDVLESDRVADDLSRKAMPIVRVRGRVHPTILAQTAPARQSGLT